MISSMPPGALGIGGWSGPVTPRWYSTGGSTQAWFPVLDLQPSLQRWEFAGREVDTLGFRYEALGAARVALLGSLLAIPQAGEAGDRHQPAMTRHFLGLAARGAERSPASLFAD